MRRAPWLFLAGALSACSGSDPLPDAGPVDSGADVGAADSGVTDRGFFVPDATVEVDAGFGDPATLAFGHDRVEGIRTYLHIRGTTTSTMPPVIMLNTGPMVSFEYWDTRMDYLLGAGGVDDPNRLLVFYDMRGTGNSGFGTTGNATITFPFHVSDLEDVVDYVDEFSGNTGPVDIIGHGYGAAVGVHFAVNNPQKVSRMVLIGPHPVDVEQQARFFEEFNNRLSTSDRMLLSMISEWNYCLRDFLRCSRETWQVIGPTWMCDDNRDLFGDMLFRYVEIRPMFYTAIPRLREMQYDWRPTLAQVTQPTTIITGPCDAIQERTFQAYTSSISGAVRHVLPNTGHFPMVEDPDGLERIVRQALTY